MSALPDVLAGPIVRRTTPDRVVVWIAATTFLDPPHLALYDGGAADAARIACDAEYYPVMLGAKLVVYLLMARPRTPLRPGAVYGYDVLLNGRVPLFAPGDLEQIVLRRQRRPTFLLGRTRGTDIRLLYGSCRKLHGPPPDLMRAADERLAERKAAERPEYLLLGGDQVYADDVAGSVLAFSAPLRTALFTRTETIPGLPPTVYDTTLSRTAALKPFFTSSHMDHHLLTFAEYASVYLLAWNPALWIYLKTVGAAGDRPAIPTHMVLGARRARRVLANVVTYMCFDDHEVTDDWFRTERWTGNLERFRGATQIAANGMAAYWAFQGWGNDPDAFDDGFRSMVGGYALSAGRGAQQTYQSLKNARWSFVAPTAPPIVVLDTRTKRATSKGYADSVDYGFQPRSIHPLSPGLLGQGIQSAPTVTERVRNREAPRLLDADERDRVASLIRAHARPGMPLIVVAPAPVFGYPPLEKLQDEAGRLRPDMADLESWGGNPRNLIDAVDLFGARRPAPLVILSGDVHYGFEVTGRIWRGADTFPFLQLCSSALKNKPIGTEAKALAFLSRFWNEDRSYIYWDWHHDDEADGPIAWMDASRPSTKVFDALYGERSFAIATQFLRREGRTDAFGRIETRNNLGELEIERGVVWHRHWTVDAQGKTITRPWQAWRLEQWPIPDLAMMVRQVVEELFAE